MKSTWMCFLLYLFSLCFVFLEKSASAFEIAASTGALHLPDSSYHYLAFQFSLRSSGKSARFRFDLGGTPPHSSLGFSQIIVFSGASIEWHSDSTSNFFRPYGGCGIGVFGDRVNSMMGWVPALLLQGGIKVGGSRVGVDFSFSGYTGVYDTSHVEVQTVWPLINAMAGVYVAL
jgi:hypothetical protein